MNLNQLKYMLLEATKPYVFMFESQQDFYQLRSGIDMNFKDLRDGRLFIEINEDEISIVYKGWDYVGIRNGLYDGFDLLSPKFTRKFDCDNHVNKEENKEKAKKAFNIASKRYSDCDMAIPYTLARTIGPTCDIFKYGGRTVPVSVKQKFVNYVRYEQAWKQQEVDVEVFPDEEPWKFWQNTLIIPFIIGSYFSQVFGTDSIDL